MADPDRLEDLIAIIDRALLSSGADDATFESDHPSQLKAAKRVLQDELKGHFQRAEGQLGNWTDTIQPKGGR